METRVNGARARLKSCSLYKHFRHSLGTNHEEEEGTRDEGCCLENYTRDVARFTYICLENCVEHRIK
jgi:hypothetical protein